MARFEREAKLLAALNHPNIAAIYGLEEAVGRRFLVLELVEGETLAERIGRGPVPVEEALLPARQLAEALEYAHERGIIHRDLKPANIKLTPEGRLKVLDFGLAKALETRAVVGDPGAGPTLTSPAMTQAGIILGTAAYMSPEQARGASVDKRTDIWAFGVVLFEMLTGRPCFPGDSVTDVLAAVVKSDPNWAALPADTPPRVRDLLRRCLAKDRKQRLRDIGDAGIDIENALDVDSDLGTNHAEATTASGLMRRPLRERLAWFVAGVGIAALVISTVHQLSRRARGPDAGQPGPLRVSVLHTEGNDVGAPVISPDGRQIAYRGRRSDDMPMIWVRDLEVNDPRPLEGTEGGWLPFWSPDSQHIGFMAGLKLKRIPLGGGPVEVVSGSGGVNGAAWAADNMIVFPDALGRLYKVRADGGEATPLEAGKDRDWFALWPSMLPDGRRFLFTARQFETSRESSAQGVYLASLDGDEIQRLLPDVSSAVYAAPGHIVFARNGRLAAAPFDLASGRVTGEAVSLGPAVSVDPVYGLAALSAASDGTLAVRYAPGIVLGRVAGPGSGAVQMQWVGRDGKVLQTVGEPLSLAWYMVLSPDARRVAAAVTDPQSLMDRIWVIDTASGHRQLLTTQGGSANFPAWSPDGRLAFSLSRPGEPGTAFIKDLTNGSIVPLTDDRRGAGNTGTVQHPMSWSPDGLFLLVRGYGAQSQDDLFVWSRSDGKMTPFLVSRETEIWGTFSPDGRFVAFSSYETGQVQAYVTTFPDRRQTWTLTSEGGWVRGWRKDGREIVVATLSGHLVAYPVTTEGGFRVTGPPSMLVSGLGTSAMFAVPTHDHSRFLVRVSQEANKDIGEIKLLFRWARALKK